MSTSQSSYHHGDLRAALIEAGIAALEGADGDAPSLRALAREVGVSATAVYRHFPDKQALLDALAQEGLDRLGTAQALAMDRCTGNQGEKFAESGREYVRFALAHPALFRLVFSLGDPDKFEMGQEDRAGALLRSATRALTGNDADAERLALQAWAIAHGTAMLMLDGRIRAHEDVIRRLLNAETLFPRRRPQGSRSEESP